MKFNLKKTIVLVSLLIPSLSFAGGYNIETLTGKALENRELVKSYKYGQKQAELGVSVEKGDFLPSLDAGYKANKLDEDSAFEAEENSEFAVSITQNLFKGFKDKNEYEIASLNKDIADLRLFSVKQDIALEVSTAVLGVFEAESQKKVAEDAFKAYVEKYENTKLKYSIGVAKKRDLLIMKVEKDDSAQKLTKAENEVLKALNNLKRITGTELKVESIDFMDFNGKPVFNPFSDYEKEVVLKRSDIRILKAEIDKSRFSKKLARAAYYPSLDLILAKKFTSKEYSAWDSDSGEDESRVQLKMEMNIFDGMKKQNKVDQAFMAEKKADMELKELEKNLLNRLENLLLDAKTAEKNLDVANEGIKEAEENLRITELSFDNGVATATDVLDSIYYLSRARTNRIKAKAALYTTWFNVKRLIADYKI